MVECECMCHELKDSVEFVKVCYLVFNVEHEDDSDELVMYESALEPASQLQ